MCAYEDFLWFCLLTGVWSSSRAAQRWPDTHPGRGEEEDSEWRDEAASGGENSVFLSPRWNQEVEDVWLPFCFLPFEQRAQYQDKLARQRYEEQLRQQVRPSCASSDENTLERDVKTYDRSNFPPYSKSWMRKTFANRRNPCRNRKPWGKVGSSLRRSFKTCRAQIDRVVMPPFL